jgi:hypothetical protein
MDFYPGAVHGHHMMMPSTSVGKEANVDQVVGLAWLIGKDVSRGDVEKAMGLDAPVDSNVVP